MKKLSMILALVLCMALACPSALAQAAYTPNQPTTNALVTALTGGKMVMTDIKMSFDMNGTALGMDEEEQQVLDAIERVVRQVTLTVGVGAAGEDGVRIALNARMDQDGGSNSVSIGGTADVTADGVALESDVIPGKRITCSWETVLGMAGLNEMEIAQIMALKEVDVEAAAAEAITQLTTSAQQIGTMVMPYMQTVAAFVQSLPMEVKENLNKEGYPPTAQEICVTLTQADIGRLINTLADQLEKDETAKAFIDEMMASAGEEATCAELIAAMRDAAANEFTDAVIPIDVYVGMNEAGLPMYAEVSITNDEIQQSFYAGLFLYETEPAGGVFEMFFGLYDAQKNPTDGMYIGGVLTGDANDENVFALEGGMTMIEDGAVIVDAVLNSTNTAIDANGQPGYANATNYSFAVNDDDEAVQMVCATNAVYAATPNGGETTMVESKVDMYADGMAMNVIAEGAMTIEPTADGGLMGTYSITESMPSMGLDSFGMSMDFYTQTADMAASAALEPVAMENATDETLETLMAEAMGALQLKAAQLMSVVPADLLVMLLNAQ